MELEAKGSRRRHRMLSFLAPLPQGVGFVFTGILFTNAFFLEKFVVRLRLSMVPWKKVFRLFVKSGGI
jgi:hypothetical protein